jgi:hypothetical protein
MNVVYGVVASETQEKAVFLDLAMDVGNPPFSKKRQKMSRLFL